MPNEAASNAPNASFQKLLASMQVFILFRKILNPGLGSKNGFHAISTFYQYLTCIESIALSLLLSARVLIRLTILSDILFCRLMTRFMLNQRKYTLNSVLSKLSCPLLLIWGDLDPWVGPAKAVRIKEFYQNTSVVNLQAGHCPHDEVPELVNKALLDWLSTLPSTSSLQTV